MARFNGGWFKTHRDILDKDLFCNVYLWGIWYALLCMATYKETQIIWEGKQRKLPPGSVVFGVKELADKWGCAPNTLWSKLKHLHKTERIVLETCTRGTLVTICNWEQYQGLEETPCTPPAHQLHANCTPTAHGLQLNEESTIKKEEERNTNTYVGHTPTTPPPLSLVAPTTEPPNANEGPTQPEVQSIFEEYFEQYPKRYGDQGKKRALAACAKKFKTPEQKAKLLTAIKNYHAYCTRKGWVGTEYVKMFATFVNSSWEEYLKAPEQLNGIGGHKATEQFEAMSNYALELFGGDHGTEQ